ncbi:MAG: TonB family protein [Firmicutes bacterium]|nr:TonB family protein [Bacillota bacterium]
MGRKLRLKDNLRSFYSFLLASGIHLLFLLCNWGGYWGGVEAGQIRIIPVYSRLVVVEEKKPVVTERPAAVKKDPPAEKKEVQLEREAKAEMAEVVQEQPAPRQAPPVEKEEPPSPDPVPGEVAEVPTHEQEVPGENQDPGPAEESGDTEPPLPPPLGEAGGMVASHPMTYHKDLQHEMVEGRIRLEVFLSADGNLLTEPVILQSSGDVRLDEHCLKTVTRYWQFKPASGPYKITVEVVFSQQEERPIIEFLGDAVYFSPEGGDS